MGYVTQTLDPAIGIETRMESMYIYCYSEKPGIFTWTPTGGKGCAAFEISYEMLARLIRALNAPDVQHGIDGALSIALERLTAQAEEGES